MPYGDSSFDLVIDKGTFDALACSADKTISESVLREMARVASKFVVEISNGDEAKRLPLFSGILPEAEISAEKIELSSLSTLINILRAGLKDKPLSKAAENPQLLKYALSVIDVKGLEARSQIEATDGPREKLKKMMLKMRVKQKREELEAMRTELDLDSDAESRLEGYSPKRQDFVVAYLLRV